MMRSLQPDEYDYYYRHAPNGHHYSDSVWFHNIYQRDQRRRRRNKYRKILQEKPKYRKTEEMDDYVTNLHHIKSDNQYIQRLVTLITAFTFKHKAFICMDIEAIIINYYSPFHHRQIDNSFYCVYPCIDIDIKDKRKLKQKEIENASSSIIERIDLESNEYLTYHPTLSNDKRLVLRHDEGSYIKEKNIVYKIGSNLPNNIKYTNFKYNLENGKITKLPFLQCHRIDVGLCYSDKYGLLCIGGKSRISATNWRCKYYDNMDQLKLNNNTLKWISLTNIAQKRSAMSCIVLQNEDKMFVCGGKITTADPWIYEFDSMYFNQCELYDFINSKWIKLDDIPQDIEGNGSLIQSQHFNNSIVAYNGNNCIYYDFIKNKWYSLPDTNNSYYDGYKLTQKSFKKSSNIITVVGMDIMLKKYHNESRVKYNYYINIEIYDNRDNANKWIEWKSIEIYNAFWIK